MLKTLATLSEGDGNLLMVGDFIMQQSEPQGEPRTTSQEEEIVIVGKRPGSGTGTDLGGPGGGGGGSGGGQGSGGTEPPPPPPPVDPIDVLGRDCPVDQAAAKDSLKSLYDNSPTARALINAAAAAGVDLSLIKADLSGYGGRPQFEAGVITWDPFLVIEGANSDGSIYTLAPIMVLAHELVHAGNMGDVFIKANVQRFLLFLLPTKSPVR